MDKNGLLDGYKKWMDKNNGWLDAWIEKNGWMVRWKDNKYENKIDGWLDG